jgi:hypothetical protein
MAIEQVCAHVVGNAAHKHHKVSIEEIRQKYDTRSAAKARRRIKLHRGLVLPVVPHRPTAK